MRNQSKRGTSRQGHRDQPSIARERYREACQDGGGKREAGRMLTRCA